MRKRICMLLYITFSITLLVSQNWENVLEKKFGNEDQQIGLEFGGESYHSVMAIAFDKFNNLYIGDKKNYRILVYNKSFDFIKMIKTEPDNLLDRGSRILIDDNLDIINLSSSGGFKIDNDGKILIPYSKKFLPNRSYTWKHVSLYENKLVGNKRPDGELFVIDEKGLKIDNEIIFKIRDEKKSITSVSKVDELNENDFGKFNAFLNEKGKLYTREINEYKKLAKLYREKKSAREIKSQKINGNPKTSKGSEKKSFYFENNPESTYDNLRVIDVDNKSNVYCQDSLRTRLIVFDKYGNQIKSIDASELKKTSNIYASFFLDKEFNVYYIWMNSDVGFILYKYNIRL